LLKIFFKKKLSKKGFIGPIGDDLPSLIPIVVSLLLFFTIFAITLNSYSSKNSEIAKQTVMISASREMKGDSIILSYEQFKDRCDRLKLKYYPYNFMMAVYPTGGINSSEELQYVLTNFTKMSFDQEGKLTLSGYDYVDNIVGGDGKKYVCGYKKKQGSNFSGKTKSYYLRYYPIAVQIDQDILGKKYVVILPAVMAVIVWE
jgi:hypothetical protein